MPIRVSSKRPAAAPPQSREAVPFGLPIPPADRPQKPEGISLCMIVKNEERFLAQCLHSVADVVDEIIIVDTGSTDRTIEIAKSFGASIIEREWRNDFAWARNESIKSATKRWILFLDADEELTPESKPELRKLRSAPAHHHAVWVRCYNKSDDYRGTGDMSHVLIRIFPNAPEIRFRGLIHEYPSVNGDANGLQAVLAPINIVHHGYLKEVVAQRNKLQRNLDIVKAAAEQDPTDPFHWFNLGTTAFQAGDYEQTRDALEEMIRKNGSAKRGFMPNGLALLAETYCDKLGDPVNGERISRRALELAPRYANAHFQLGKALVAQKRHEEAREAYKAAIDDGAYAHLQFVIDDQVYVWKAHCEIGSSFAAQGDDEKALEWFARALKNAPKVQPVQVNHARALDRLQRFDEAQAAFRDAFETHRDDLTSIDYVNFLLRRGNGRDALEVIESVHAQLSDAGASALLVAGFQIASKLAVPTVERYLLAAAERTPGNAEILNPLETILRARGDHETLAALLAREEATTAISAADWLRRSHRAIAENRFEDALVASESGIANSPENPLLHYNAAIALANLGRKEEALHHLAFISVPHGEAYLRGELLRAVTLRELDRPEEALAAVERLLAEDPNQVDGLLLRAALLESRGDVADAEALLRRTLLLNRKRIGVELASLYLRAGRFADAARVAQEALEG